MYNLLKGMVDSRHLTEFQNLLNAGFDPSVKAPSDASVPKEGFDTFLRYYSY